MTYEEAVKKIVELKNQYYAIESEMVELALEHNIELYLEGKGSLLLEDDTGWGYKKRGEWYTSTDSCS